MEPLTLSWLPFEHLSVLTHFIQSELGLALAMLALTATLVTMCVPGVIIPLSFCSGAMLGGWTGILVVITGALLGSQVLFAIVRHLIQGRVKRRFGGRLARFNQHFARRGIVYVIGLRLAGAPHFLVTAGSALAPLPARAFALATMIGFLPVVAIAAAAGSVV